MRVVPAQGLVLLAGVPEQVARDLRGRLAPLPVWTARDATELLQIVEREPVRVLLVHHAFTNGEGALRQIRALPGGSALPVFCCVRCEGDGSDARHLSRDLAVAGLLCDPLDAEDAAARLAPYAAAPPAAPADPPAAVPFSPPPPPPPADTAAALGDAVEALWQRFRGSILERVATLEEAAVALLSGALDAELRRRAEREAHKLAGAVGTFGFAEASRIARSAELLLEGVEPLGDEDALRLSEWVLELRTRLEQSPAAAGAEAAPMPDRPLLLLVGMDAELAERVEMEAVGRGFGVRRVDSPAAAPAALPGGAPAAVLLNAGSDALSPPWLRLMDELALRTPAPAVLVLSDTDSFAERVEIARRGGAAFLHRPVPPALVVDTVARLVAPSDVAGFKVMLVDDDAQVREVVATLLGAHGLEVMEVSDPLRFWTELGRALPDLVILDQDMPGLSGVEICRVLRNDPRWRTLPVLFLTARTEAEFIQRIFASGADDYVAKPVVGPELVTRVVSRLERLRLESGLSQAVGPGGVPGRERVAAEVGRLLQLARRSEAAVAAVSGQPEGEVRVERWQPAAGVLHPGQEAVSEMAVRNLRAEPRTVWIGYSVQDPGGVWHDVDAHPVELPPGGSSGPQRKAWVVAPGAAGEHRVVMAVWDRPPGSRAARRLAHVERAGAFRVVATRSAEALRAAGWRPGDHALGRGRVEPANVRWEAEALQLRLRHQEYGGAEVRSAHHFGTGVYTARLRAARAPGSLTALFLYQGVPGGNDEIDIEIPGDGSRTVLLTGWVAGEMVHHEQAELPFDPTAGFHDYAIERGPDEIVFRVDGVAVSRWRERLPQEPLLLMLNAWWPTWMEPTGEVGAPAAVEWVRY